MEQKETLKKQPKDELTDLFERAHRDPELKRELLLNPKAVADRFKVTFNDDEVKQLQSLGALSELADEIRYGRLYPRPPIFYPIHIWEISELLDIFYRLLPGTGPIFYPSIGPIFYPGPDWNRMPSFAYRASRAYSPGWITYPGDDQGGGGGSGGGGYTGGVIPGPIFYPASLISFIKERLVNILKIQAGFNR